MICSTVVANSACRAISRRTVSTSPAASCRATVFPRPAPGPQEPRPVTGMLRSRARAVRLPAPAPVLAHRPPPEVPDHAELRQQPVPLGHQLRKRRLGHGHSSSGFDCQNQTPIITREDVGPLHMCRTPPGNRETARARNVRALIYIAAHDRADRDGAALPVRDPVPGPPRGRRQRACCSAPAAASLPRRPRPGRPPVLLQGLPHPPAPAAAGTAGLRGDRPGALLHRRGA